MIVTYQERLNSDLNWAFDEAERFFAPSTYIHKALRRLTAQLSACGVSHAVAGDVAYFCHGMRRMRERIEVVVTAAGMQFIRDRLDTWGYVRLMDGDRRWRDIDFGANITIRVTADNPGDDTPKPVAFPDPALASVELAGIPCLNLPTLIELSLATGKCGPDYQSDLANVVGCITQLQLPRDFAYQLNPYVRAKFEELSDGVRQSRTLE